MAFEPTAGYRRREGRPAGRSGLLTLTLTLIAVLGAAGCGNKENPKPPPSRIPQPTTDLTVQQRGDELMLRMTYPTLTVGGTMLEEIEAIEVWQIQRVLPSFLFQEGGQPPADAESGEVAAEPGEADAPAGEEDVPAGEEGPPAGEAPEGVEEQPAEAPEVAEEELDEPPAAAADVEAEAPAGERPRSLMFQFPAPDEEDKAEAQPMESFVSADPATFRSDAELRVSLSGAELDAAVTGDKIVIRLPAGEPSAEGETAYIFGVKTVAPRRLTSPFSNLVKIVLRQPPAGPTSIAVVARERGVELNWESEEAAKAKGFHVYRRLAQERGYGEPIYKAAPTLSTYLDAAASYGNRYIYTVTALASHVPVVESAITAEFEIDYQDRFAPVPPTNPVALPEPGQVRLLWEPSRADDLSGYLVLRGLEGETPGAIHLEPVTGLEYVDADVVAGRSYGYRIVAVDQNGNRSQPTDEVRVRVP